MIREAAPCIALRMAPPPVLPAWYRRWRAALAPVPVGLDDREQEAFARVLPLLWCGEQSAITVFASEAERLSGAAWSASVDRFRAIAADEAVHEAGLAELAARLPVPSDLHRVRRRAQRFFLGLGRTQSVAGHFGQIAHLDQAVCVLIHRLEGSRLGRSDALEPLLDHIKRDEARHVSVSRRHAFELGLGRDAFHEQGSSVRAGLLGLLESVGDAFETLGLDLDGLARRFGRLT